MVAFLPFQTHSQINVFVASRIHYKDYTGSLLNSELRHEIFTIEK